MPGRTVVRWLKGDRRRVRGAVSTTFKGITFRSKREATRYGELLLLERAGKIRGLRRQVRFPLHTVDPLGLVVVVGHYVADFTYFDAREDRDERTNYRVEDAKGWRTEIYDWKRRHMKAEYHIIIREI
jgi:hypothetical protein